MKSHIPPPRAPRSTKETQSILIPPAGDTPKRVQDILHTSVSASIKKRPFYPLWQKTR